MSIGTIGEMTSNNKKVCHFVTVTRIHNFFLEQASLLRQNILKKLLPRLSFNLRAFLLA